MEGRKVANVLFYSVFGIFALTSLVFMLLELCNINAESVIFEEFFGYGWMSFWYLFSKLGMSMGVVGLVVLIISLAMIALNIIASKKEMAMMTKILDIICGVVAIFGLVSLIVYGVSDSEFVLAFDAIVFVAALAVPATMNIIADFKRK